MNHFLISFEEVREDTGFNVGVSRNGTHLRGLTEKDDFGVQLYEALFDSIRDEDRTAGMQFERIFAELIREEQ